MPKPIAYELDESVARFSDEPGLEARRREHCRRAFRKFATDGKSTFMALSFEISDESVRAGLKSAWEDWNRILDALNPDAFESLESYEGAVDRLDYAELDGVLSHFAFESQSRLIADKRKGRNQRAVHPGGLR